MESVRQRLSRRAAYSYRVDPLVPSFPETRAVIVFDGVCALCSAFVRWVLKHDESGQFAFVPAQSALGQALFRHYGLDPVSFETNLLIEEGIASGKLDAFVAIAHRLGGRRRLVAKALQVMPPSMADFLYDRIARNRYRLFGRTATCMVPPPGAAKRFLA